MEFKCCFGLCTCNVTKRCCEEAYANTLKEKKEKKKKETTWVKKSCKRIYSSVYNEEIKFIKSLIEQLQGMDSDFCVKEKLNSVFNSIMLEILNNRTVSTLMTGDLKEWETVLSQPNKYSVNTLNSRVDETKRRLSKVLERLMKPEEKEIESTSEIVEEKELENPICYSLIYRPGFRSFNKMTTNEAKNTAELADRIDEVATAVVSIRRNVYYSGLTLNNKHLILRLLKEIVSVGMHNGLFLINMLSDLASFNEMLVDPEKTTNDILNAYIEICKKLPKLSERRNKNFSFAKLVREMNRDCEELDRYKTSLGIKQDLLGTGTVVDNQ